jgi:hypothetical protein
MFNILNHVSLYNVIETSLDWSFSLFGIKIERFLSWPPQLFIIQFSWVAENSKRTSINFSRVQSPTVKEFVYFYRAKELFYFGLVPQILSMEIYEISNRGGAFDNVSVCL